MLVPGADAFVVLQGPVSPYKPEKAASWAKEHFEDDEKWLCAEFVARALQAGGELSCEEFDSCQVGDLVLGRASDCAEHC